MSTTKTNDSMVIGLDELLENFGTSAPQNDAQVNSFKGRPVSTPAIYVSGDARINGLVKSILALDKPILLSQWSAAAPALGFRGDTSTGFFQPTPGSLEFVSGGDPVLKLSATEALFYVPITTPPGVPFIINSAIQQNATGGVGGATTQYAVGAITADANPTPLLNIASDGPLTNRVYAGEASIAAANTTTGADVASYQFIFRAKKLGPVFTVNGPLQLTQVVDTSLAAAVVSVAGGASLTVVVQGVVATGVRWTGKINLTTQDF
jgi:hypothetical protein